MHYEAFFKRLPLNARVLDVGCGNGQLTVEIARMVPTGFVLGVDSCYPTLVNSMITHIRPDRPNLRFFQSDARCLCLGEEPFDYVLSKGCLHYLEHPGHAFSAMARNLKPGGTMYCWFLGRGNAERIQRVLRRLTKADPWQGYLADCLPWEYATLDSCRPWLRRAGLTFKEGLLREEELVLADRGELMVWLRRNWSGYFTRIPQALIEVFESQFLEMYLEANSGRYSVQRIWLVLEACKSIAREN